MCMHVSERVCERVVVIVGDVASLTKNVSWGHFVICIPIESFFCLTQTLFVTHMLPLLQVCREGRREMF